MIDLLIDLETPSQNKRERWHWSKQRREVTKWTNWFMYVKRPGGMDNAKGKRAVSIIAYRTRLCTDQANFEGGCKGLLDGLVRAGLLIDDSTKWMTATYEQRKASLQPDGKPRTHIQITETPE